MEASFVWLFLSGFILLVLITSLFRLVRKHHLMHQDDHQETFEMKFSKSDLDDWALKSENSYQSLWGKPK